jgi:methionyl-tRNA formyltransferase
LEARLAEAAPAMLPGATHGTVVGTGDGALELELVQPESKAPMAATAWRNGAALAADDVLGS